MTIKQMGMWLSSDRLLQAQDNSRQDLVDHCT